MQIVSGVTRSRGVVWAIVGIVLSILVLASLVVPVASHAYVPARFPANAGSNPSNTVKVWHEPAGDEAPGAAITYRAEFDLSELDTAINGIVTTLRITGSEYAPFDGDITTADFSGVIADNFQVSFDADTNSWIATLTNPKDSTITFSKGARISNDAPDATLINVVAAMETAVPFDVDIRNLREEFVWDEPDRCSGVVVFESEVGAGGGWLMDIKFADLSGGKVRPDTGTLVAGDPSNGLRVTDPTRGDITAEVLAAHQYRDRDPFPPTVEQNVIVGPKVRWIDSLNWNWDPSTWTGDTWLPAGTRVEIRRHVEYANCLPPSIASDFDLDRPFGIAIEISRPRVTVNASDVDTFRLPGELKPLRCEEQMFISSTNRTTGVYAPKYLHIWDGQSAPANIYTGNIPSYAIAASPKYPAAVIGINQFSPEGTSHKMMWAYDGETGLYTEFPNVTLPIFPGAQSPNLRRLQTMASDRYGNIFAVADAGGREFRGPGTGALVYLTKEEIDRLMIDPNADIEWSVAGQLNNSDNRPAQTSDIAIDADGKIYMNSWNSYTTGSGVQTSQDIFTAELSDFITYGPDGSILGHTGATEIINPLGIRGTYPRFPNGMAFFKGKLLLGTGNDSITTLYEVDLVNKQLVPNPREFQGYRIPYMHDFASCDFGSNVTPEGGFQLYKSALNADGTISAPGGVGAPVKVADDGSVTARYVVQVANLGEEEAEHNEIRDEYTSPAGFTIEDILVDGVSQVPAGTTPIGGTQFEFRIPPASVPGNGVANYVVTVKMRAERTETTWADAGRCESYSGTALPDGFHNLVSMTGSSNETLISEACVPTEPPSLEQSLTLIKRVVDANGNDLGAERATDSQFFTLVALNNATATGIAGTSATSGDNAVSAFVPAGKYALGESPNDGPDHAITRNYVPGEWACDAGTLTGSTVEVLPGAHVTCTITNTLTPDVHIVKAAADPADPSNIHIGNPVEADRDGRVTLNYAIRVYNDAGFSGDTGNVWEYFRVPAGLVWDAERSIAVEFDARATGAEAIGFNPVLISALSEEQFRKGVILAESIKNLPAGSDNFVEFQLSIPLKLDTSEGENGQTVFENNQERLGTCAPRETEGLLHTDTTKGVPNVTSLEGENLNYSAIALQDNIACIPVVPPAERPITLIKQALDCDVNVPTCRVPGAEFAIYDVDPSSEGATPIAEGLKVNAEDASEFLSVPLRDGEYWIVETKAPEGFNLLATPVHFSLDQDGITVLSEGLVEVSGEDKMILVVNDVIKGELPVTGGSGPMKFLLVGMVLLALAAMRILNPFATGRKS